jgi:preprotein translocase subunit SecF
MMKTTNFNFDFMAKRRIAMMLSIGLLLIAVLSLAIRGLNLGIDFTGGTLIELGYPDVADLEQIRATLKKTEFSDAVVQYFGTSQDVLIRVAPREGMNHAELSSSLMQHLQPEGSQKIDIRRVEFVGPQVGDELTEDGGMAMLYALLGILIYVAFRFEYRFAFGAIVALMHDVLIAMGVFSLFQFDFDLTVLAAILAVIGYSLNDTIVVYDRIRENFRKMRKGDSVEIINRSLSQTFSRTIMTSVTTLLVLISLFVFGGEIIHQFALALIIGVLVGTYSSIYVASSTILALGITKQDLMPPAKEGAVDEQGNPIQMEELG